MHTDPAFILLRKTLPGRVRVPGCGRARPGQYHHRLKLLLHTHRLVPSSVAAKGWDWRCHMSVWHTLKVFEGLGAMCHLSSDSRPPGQASPSWLCCEPPGGPRMALAGEAPCRTRPRALLGQDHGRMCSWSADQLPVWHQEPAGLRRGQDHKSLGLMNKIFL